MMNPDRRRLVLGFTGLLAAGASAPVAALIPTPGQSAGPFYPETLTLDDDNDLTQVSGKNGKAKGVITDNLRRISSDDGWHQGLL